MKLLVESFDQPEILKEEQEGKRKYYIKGIFMQAGKPNGNHRIYPAAVMEAAANKYISGFVDKHRAYGELDHHCFEHNVEVLTQHGWKKITDVAVGETAYTVNVETGAVELDTVAEVIQTHYSGEMLHFEGRCIDTSVTPAHKFLLRDRNGKLEYRQADTIASDIDSGAYRHHSILKRVSGLIQSDEPKVVHFPAVNRPRVSRCAVDVDFDSFCLFLGIYLAEGSCSIVKDHPNCYKIALSQNVGAKADEIDRILSGVSCFHFARYERNRKQFATHVTWCCTDPRLGAYLSVLGKCYNKYVPKDILSRLDAKSAELLIDGFMLGDGRGVRGVSHGHWDMFTTSAQLRDDLAHAAIVAGYPFSTHTEICGKDYVFAEKLIHASDKSPLYFTNLLKHSGVYLDPRFVSVSRKLYDGDVYCLRMTRNSNFCVRENGHSFWTGNSGNPSTQLQNVSHIIESLTRDGNNWIGKARIIDEGMGKIAIGLIDAGANLGVSSRALGSVKMNRDKLLEVQPDFRIISAADLVANPSAPEAFVDAIMESQEWVYENGVIKEVDVESVKPLIESAVRNGNQDQRNATFLTVWNKILGSL